MEIKTGVFQINNLDGEDLYNDMNNGYDLGYYNHLVENNISLEEAENKYFDIESGEVLIGFRPIEENTPQSWYWFESLGVGFEIDPGAEYSAVVGENVVQVVKSRWAIQGSPFNSCYPNQVDGDEEGDEWGYSLPPEMLPDRYIPRQRETKAVITM